MKRLQDIDLPQNFSQICIVSNLQLPVDIRSCHFQKFHNSFATEASYRLHTYYGGAMIGWKIMGKGQLSADTPLTELTFRRYASYRASFGRASFEGAAAGL